MSGPRSPALKLALAAFILAALAMFANEWRLQRQRPPVALPQAGYTIHITYMHRHSMYISRQDEAERLGIVLAIMLSLGTVFWLERRAR